MMFKKCRLCECKQLTPEEENDFGYFSYSEKFIELASGNYSSLKLVKDSSGRMCMFGVGDDNTNFYYPKFCPECGSQLQRSDGRRDVNG